MPLLTQHETTKIVQSFAHLEILMGLVAGDFPETLAQFNEADVHDAGQAIWKAANFPQYRPATHRPDRPLPPRLRLRPHRRLHPLPLHPPRGPHMSHLLTLHAGALRVHPDALSALVTPSPTKSKTGRDFVPIPHAEFRTQILRACEVANLSIVEEEHAVWGGESGADRYFCAFALRALQEDYQLVIGGRNSHDHAFAAAACLGSRVFICDNLAFSAEITFRVLHTKNIRTTLEKKAQEAIAQIAHRRANLDAQISHFKEIPISSDPLKLALISLVRRHHVLSMTDLNSLLDSWESNCYNIRGMTPAELDAAGGIAVPLEHTAWGLYNLITNHLKGLSPDTLQKRTIHLHQAFVSLTGAPTTSSAADPELPDERPESNDPSSGPIFDPADDPARLGPPDEPPFGA